MDIDKKKNVVKADGWERRELSVAECLKNHIALKILNTNLWTCTNVLRKA